MKRLCFIFKNKDGDVIARTTNPREASAFARVQRAANVEVTQETQAVEEDIHEMPLLTQEPLCQN
jgi:hypothetical protein